MRIPPFEGYSPKEIRGDGPIPCPLMLVGEAPGYHEDLHNRVFDGESGWLLDEYGKRAGLRRGIDYHITNTVNRRPPGNRKPTPAEVRFNLPRLMAEIEEVNPRVIVALGDTALKALTGRSGVSRHRGVEIRANDRLVLPTFHPSPQNTRFGDLIVADLRRAVMLLDGPTGGAPIETIILRSVRDIPADVLDLLPRCSVLAYDVETTGLSPYEAENKMLGIGVAFEPHRAFYFLPPTWWWLQKRGVFSSTKRVYIAHNGKFDNQWLRRYGVVVRQTFDTQLAAYVLNENRSTYKLERLAVEVLGADPYHEGTDALLKEGNAEAIPTETLAERCARDAVYTFRLYVVQRGELLVDTGLTNVFRHLMMPTSRILESVEATGLPLNIPLLQDRYSLLQEAKTNHHTKMLEIAGEGEVNLNSPKVLRHLLFEKFKLPVIKRTEKTKQPATDADTMAALKGRHPFIEHMMVYKKCEKFDSSYYTRWLDKQRGGWLRGTFYIGRQDRADGTLGGTTTGRLAGDLQQIPRQHDKTPLYLRMKDLICAPPGFSFVEGDFSQIELRMTAWIANEKTMQAAYREGRDLHAETARDILRKAEPTKKDRQDAKPVNFGFLYRMGAKTFVEYALTEYGVKFTLAEAEAIRLAYYRKFHDLPAYYLRQEAEARRTKEVRTVLGRRRHLYDISSPRKEAREEAIRQAINTPIQATASDLNTLAFIEASRNMPPGAHLLLPYHDASLWLVRDSDVEATATILKHAMEVTVPNVILPTKFGVQCPVPLVAEIKVGKTWGAMVELVLDTAGQ